MFLTCWTCFKTLVLAQYKPLTLNENTGSYISPSSVGNWSHRILFWGHWYVVFLEAEAWSPTYYFFLLKMNKAKRFRKIHIWTYSSKLQQEKTPEKRMNKVACLLLHQRKWLCPNSGHPLKTEFVGWLHHSDAPKVYKIKCSSDCGPQICPHFPRPLFLL